MARGPAAGPRTASTVYRLPTEGDHPVAVTVGCALALGLAAFVFSVLGEGRRRRGLGLPLPWAAAVGGVVTAVALVGYGLWVRTVPRGQALRVGPEGLAFTQGRTERWAVPWEAVASAGIVHPALPERRGEPAPSYLRLELGDGCVPQDPSLHRHDGAWWFPLSGFDTAARLHHDLHRRIPGRARRAGTEVRLPSSLARREASRRRLR